ncbi:MAG: hypothetical protein AB7R55_23730 [Gemmatimonadales bacterium]
MTVLADLALAVALLVSANLALAWAELASYPLDGDKSALAGLGAVIFLMPIRWLGLALALGLGAWRGGFAELPGSRGLQTAIVLLAHLALGIASYRGLEAVNAAIQRGAAWPVAMAWALGIALPVASLALAIWGLHRVSIGRHPWIALALFVILLGSHLAAWRSGVR